MFTQIGENAEHKGYADDSVEHSEQSAEIRGRIQMAIANRRAHSARVQHRITEVPTYLHLRVTYAQLTFIIADGCVEESGDTFSLRLIDEKEELTVVEHLQEAHSDHTVTEARTQISCS